VWGRFEERVWEYNPDLYAPPVYRKACRYQAFVPDPLVGDRFSVPGELLGVISDAEDAVRTLNPSATPALAPLARLLLRTESIASSKVEGMAVDPRSLARAEAKADLGANVSATAREVLANIDAMTFAVAEATADDRVSVERVVDIHRVLMENSPRAEIAGKVRDQQNWIGGNDYNPCGSDFVRRRSVAGRDCGADTGGPAPPTRAPGRQRGRRTTTAGTDSIELAHGESAP
jgi:hypothetical protein